MKGSFDPKGVSTQRLRTSDIQAAFAAAAAARAQAVEMLVSARQLAQLCLYSTESNGNE